MQSSSLRNNELQELTLIKIIPRFVGTGGFLIRYEINILPIKTVPPLIKKTLFNELKKQVKFKVSITEMYPLGTARGSLEIRGAHFGDQRSNYLKILK